jgi:hypothetical protein
MRESFSNAAQPARTTTGAHTTDAELSARARVLGRLVPLWPSEIEDRSAAGRQRLLVALRKALRSERQRGLSGHWTYDLARHRSLLEAYRAEASAAITPRLTDEAQKKSS